MYIIRQDQHGLLSCAIFSQTFQWNKKFDIWDESVWYNNDSHSLNSQSIHRSVDVIMHTFQLKVHLNYWIINLLLGHWVGLSANISRFGLRCSWIRWPVTCQLQHNYPLWCADIVNMHLEDHQLSSSCTYYTVGAFGGICLSLFKTLCLEYCKLRPVMCFQ